VVLLSLCFVVVPPPFEPSRQDAGCDGNLRRGLANLRKSRTQRTYPPAALLSFTGPDIGSLSQRS
jgi:hypothetical protein